MFNFHFEKWNLSVSRDLRRNYSNYQKISTKNSSLCSRQYRWLAAEPAIIAQSRKVTNRISPVTEHMVVIRAFTSPFWTPTLNRNRPISPTLYDLSNKRLRPLIVHAPRMQPGRMEYRFEMIRPTTSAWIYAKINLKKDSSLENFYSRSFCLIVASITGAS